MNDPVMNTCVDELCQESTFLVIGSVDVFVTSECIHLYILYIVPLLSGILHLLWIEVVPLV